MRLWLGLLLCVVGALLLLPVVSADFEAGRWTRVREILIPDRQAAADYVRVALDGPVYEGAQEDLRDLRVIDDQVKEVASKVILPRDEAGEQAHEATIINQALAAGGRATLTLDLGPAPPRHNRLRLETSSRNFSRRVSIEASDDNRAWELLRDDGYIFDFSRDAAAQFLTVDYPLSTRRYLRVTIENKGENKNEAGVKIDGAAILLFTSEAAKLAALPSKLLSQEQDMKRRTSVLIVDLTYAKLPSARLELETDAANFQRRVEIAGSNNADALKPNNEYLWQQVGSGEIFDIQIDRRHPRQYRIDYPEARFRYLRAVIFNYDDQPITMRGVNVSGYPRHLLFKREAGRSYRLFYGNAKAAPPRYDLEQLAAYLQPDKLPVVTLGGEQRLEPAPTATGSSPPRSPLWLWATLIASGAVLAVLIYRLARASAASRPDAKSE